MSAVGATQAEANANPRLPMSWRLDTGGSSEQSGNVATFCVAPRAEPLTSRTTAPALKELG